jgi:hypothetical protein
MTENSGGGLSSAQLRFLCDQLEYPGNNWTTIRGKITVGGRLSESQVRNLLTFICNQYDAVHSRVVRAEHGGFHQLVTDLEYFFGECVRYASSPDDSRLGDMELKQIDALSCSSMFFAVAGSDETALYYLAHHAFFDREAINILTKEIVLAAGDPEVTQGRATAAGPDRTLQPWQVKALEEAPQGVRSTRRWLDFHAAERFVPWPRPSAAPVGPAITNSCVFMLGGSVMQACDDAAKRWSISATAAINSAVCAYIAVEFGAPEISLKMISSNRFLPEFNGAVASASEEVWTAHNTAGVGQPDWCRAFSREQLNAYRYGLYDWDTVRKSPNFRSPFRSNQTVMINTVPGEVPDFSAETLGQMPDVMPANPSLAPASLTHDLQYHIVRGESDVFCSVSAGHPHFDEDTLVGFNRGLKLFLPRHFDQ